MPPLCNILFNFWPLTGQCFRERHSHSFVFVFWWFYSSFGTPFGAHIAVRSYWKLSCLGTPNISLRDPYQPPPPPISWRISLYSHCPTHLSRSPAGESQEFMTKLEHLSQPTCGYMRVWVFHLPWWGCGFSMRAWVFHLLLSPSPEALAKNVWLPWLWGRYLLDVSINMSTGSCSTSSADIRSLIDWFGCFYLMENGMAE